MLKSTRKDYSVPYPACLPLRFLVNQENSILHVANRRTSSLTVSGSFHCNIRSTQFTSVSASDLATVHTRKHFSYQLLLQIECVATVMGIQRSCDYNIYCIARKLGKHQIWQISHQNVLANFKFGDHEHFRIVR